MISLVLTLILSLLSFISSAFVILHALLPLIPGNRIHPQRRSQTRDRHLPQSEKAHLWFACLNIVSLILFVWEALDEDIFRPAEVDIVENAASCARLQAAFTMMQICFFIISTLTLVRAREAKEPSFGPLHLLVCVPVLIVIIVSAAITGVLASRGVRSFQIGTAGYVFCLAGLNTAVLAYLTATLKKIRRNLAAYREVNRSWQDAMGEIRSYCSLTPQTVEALREGSSWITSDSESCRDQMSSFSFGSSEGNHGMEKRSTWSQHDSSWLTEPSVPPSTMTDWSFPMECGSSVAPSAIINTQALPHGFPVPSQPSTPASSNSSVLGRTWTLVGDRDLEKGIGGSGKVTQEIVPVSWKSMIGWFAFIWIPSSFVLTSLLMGITRSPSSILLVLAVTTPAPILALNVILSPFPIPGPPPEDLSNLPRPEQIRSASRLSGSVTVVEGRRSVDVWLSKGHAIDGEDRLGRATSLLSRIPKLSILPVKPTALEREHRREPARHIQQYGSAAISTFVAIETCCANEMGCMADRSGVRNDDAEGSFTHGWPSEKQGFSVNNSMSMTTLPTATSRPSSRKSSTSSRNSTGKRIYRSAFATSLETIPDVSMSASPVRDHPDPKSNVTGIMPSDMERLTTHDAVHSHLESNHARQGLYMSRPLSQASKEMVQHDVLHPYEVSGEPVDVAPKDRNTWNYRHTYVPSQASPTLKQDIFQFQPPTAQVVAPLRIYKTRISVMGQDRRLSTGSSGTDEEPKRSYTSRTACYEVASGQPKPSRIPVPARLREVDVAHDLNYMASIQDYKDSRNFGLRTNGLRPPVQATKSTSEKRRVVSRSERM